MTSIVGIYNRALAHIGQSEQVADPEERSEAARKCRMFYEDCRDQMLSEIDWPFATKRAYLAEVASADPRYAHTYQVPGDCLKIQGVLGEDQARPSIIGQAPTYFVMHTDDGAVICCDVPRAVVTYTMRVIDTERFSPLAIEALTRLLASNIAMPMTAKAELVENNLRLYQNAVNRAQVQALNQQMPQPDALPEFLRARG